MLLPMMPAPAMTTRGFAVAFESSPPGSAPAAAEEAQGRIAWTETRGGARNRVRARVDTPTRAAALTACDMPFWEAWE